MREVLQAIAWRLMTHPMAWVVLGLVGFFSVLAWVLSALVAGGGR